MALSVWARNVLSSGFFFSFNFIIAIPWIQFSHSWIQGFTLCSLWVSLLLLWGYCQDRSRWLLRSLSLHPKAYRLNSGKSVWICLNLMCTLHLGSFSGGMNQPGSPSPYPVLPPYPHWFHQPENWITRSDSPAKQRSFIYSCEEKIKLKVFSGHLLPKCCSHMYFIISFYLSV